MAIIKLTPSCKDYLWGGSRLRTDFGVQSDLDPLAEAWVLSCHPDGPATCPTVPPWLIMRPLTRKPWAPIAQNLNSSRF